MERVENKLCTIFGIKCRDEITALTKGMQVNHVDAALNNPRASSLGKRKDAQGGPYKDPPRRDFGAFKCFYCAGDNIGPHMKFDCPKLKMDQGGAVKVFRRNI
ncbi:hypothetical protein P3T76_013509 [Phytophthora citrophthora]|uniref:Uncharacterized protein n=1 Tax=Phytophthora citrophthora TaxID=4793 RepID=A0AAD9LC34_9STRA|nr:hypothetical protein P3T76_013509 [Phytophthora citrophthora]